MRRTSGEGWIESEMKTLYQDLEMPSTQRLCSREEAAREEKDR